MRGLFVNGVQKKGQGATDFGYYVEETGFSRSISELERLVAEDKAYVVEVFETDNSSFHIRLKSENRRITAETEGKVEKKGSGLDNFLYHTSSEPLMPGEYEDPHAGVEAYAEYALRHQRPKGINMDDVDWESLLEE